MGQITKRSRALQEPMEGVKLGSILVSTVAVLEFSPVNMHIERTPKAIEFLISRCVLSMVHSARLTNRGSTQQ